MTQAALKPRNDTQKRSIPFIDLKAQQALIRPQVDAAIARVLDHGAYIMGPEVAAFEKELAAFCGVKHVISCANGTDALALGLMAKGVKEGDAVFVPSFTFAATAEVVAWVGATAVFVDSRADTYNIDPDNLEIAIEIAKQKGLNPACIIPVDLFGQPADYDAIDAIAKANNMWIMADAAQSFGASYRGRKVGNIGDIATTSFFPAKPLGCYGDGGAVFTNDDETAAILKSLRVHGQGSDKYDNVRVGMNGRLDTVQAAILSEKLKVFPQEMIDRQKTADIYDDILRGVVQTPHVRPDATSVWAQYTVVLPKGVDRNAVADALKEAGVPTMVYYVKPLHQQKAYAHFPTAGNGLPVCEDLATRVLSLPMSGYVSADDAEYVAQTFKNILNNL